MRGSCFYPVFWAALAFAYPQRPSLSQTLDWVKKYAAAKQMHLDPSSPIMQNLTASFHAAQNRTRVYESIEIHRDHTEDTQPSANDVYQGRSKVPIRDVSVLTSLVRYVYFSAAAHSKDCYTPPLNSTIEEVWDNRQTNTRAVLFRDDSVMEYIVAFAGSLDGLDMTDNEPTTLEDCTWAVGEQCHGCKCHKSFIDQYVPLRQTIAAHLAKRQVTGYPIIFTGHGVGGALASLAATDFRARDVAANTGTACFTYGQPRVGNGLYADFVDAQFRYDGAMFRSTKGTDFFTRFPDSSQSKAALAEAAAANAELDAEALSGKHTADPDKAARAKKQKVDDKLKPVQYHHHGFEIWNAPLSMPVFWCPGQESTACSLAGSIASHEDHGEYFGTRVGGEKEGDAVCGKKQQGVMDS